MKNSHNQLNQKKNKATCDSDIPTVTLYRVAVLHSLQSINNEICEHRPKGGAGGVHTGRCPLCLYLDPRDFLSVLFKDTS